MRDYKFDYVAHIYSLDEHRVDVVEIEPSMGGDSPDMIGKQKFEDCIEDIEKLALDDAYEKMKKEA